MAGGVAPDQVGPGGVFRGAAVVALLTDRS
jgi:hypothetical protein